VNSIKEENIPLYKGRDINRILYISGVALRLSKYENISAMEIASEIVSHFLATCSKDFQVQIVSPGWIHLELTHPFLAAWLQNLAFGYAGGAGGAGEAGEAGGASGGDRGDKRIINYSSPASLAPLPPCSPAPLLPYSTAPLLPYSPPPPLFTAQYAHARCCSLLRLAHQEGLMGLRQEGQQENYHGSVPFSKSIPWLDGHKIRLTHPASGHLIAELVQVVDQFECHSSVKWETAALNLSQAFEIFWSNCRIFGEVKTTSPELAQARLGLVMATQSVLRFLLEEKLGISALMEL